MALRLRVCLLLFSLVLATKAESFICPYGKILGIQQMECAPSCMSPDQCPACPFMCSCPSGLNPFGQICVEEVPSDIEFDNIPSVDKCSEYSSCDECISSDPDCQWCPYTPGDISVIGSRCRTSGLNDLCPVEVENPQPSYEAIKNESFSNTIQRMPQQINLRLRPGKPQNITLQFRAAENFPLDVYFLLDSTGSFSRSFRTTVTPLAEQLVTALSNISDQYAVAFGGFADKRAIPFAFPSQDPMTYFEGASGSEMCTTQILDLSDCNPTVSYIHTTDFARLERDQLSEVLNNISIHLNIDNLEGGMDALVQAITCTEQIGWRDPSLRMLLYMSNAGFHLAGDGKLGAVLDPNPGECLLETVVNNDGTTVEEYNNDTLYDYPSVYQLRELATTTQTNIVFAITSVDDALEGIYQDLAEEIAPFGRVVTLEEDSANIISVIEEAFNGISQDVRLVPQQMYNGLEFEYIPGEGCGRADEGMCTNITIGTTASITVTVTMTSCDAARKAVLTSPAFGNVELFIEPLCDCDCTQEIQNNSQSCNGNGSLQCGQCNCNTGRGGEMCECITPDGEDPTATCRTDDGLICSGPGQGRCNCGECECFIQEKLLNEFAVPFFGEHCQCDPKIACNESLTDDGKLCSGNGECMSDCETCDCGVEELTGLRYTGDICECNPRDTCYSTEYEDVCVYTDNPEVSASCDPCNGCICNRQGFDRGPDGTCVPICEKYMDCARCAKELQRDGVDCSTMEGCLLHTEDSVPVGEQCTFIDGDNCVHTFYVNLNPNGTEVRTLDGRECSGEQEGVGDLVWIIPVAVIAALLLLGALIFLLVFLIICIKDRLEYSRFKQDLEDANWDQQENPMYVSPSTQYSNVIYRPKKGIKSEEE